LSFRLEIDQDKCTGCGNCIVVCPVSALSDSYVRGGKGGSGEDSFGVSSGAVRIYNPEFCTGCGTCIGACSVSAIKLVQIAEVEQKEERMKVDSAPVLDTRREVMRVVQQRDMVGISEIAEELEMPLTRIASAIQALKSEGKLYEHVVENENGKHYLYSTRPPERKAEAAASAVSFEVDTEKAEKLKRRLSAVLENLDVVKVRFLMESGKIEKAVEEVVSRVEE